MLSANVYYNMIHIGINYKYNTVFAQVCPQSGCQSYSGPTACLSLSFFIFLLLKWDNNLQNNCAEWNKTFKKIATETLNFSQTFLHKLLSATLDDAPCCLLDRIKVYSTDFLFQTQELIFTKQS